MAMALRAGPGWRRGVVDAPPKLTWRRGVAADVEPVRVGEHRLVAVGGAEHEHQLVAGPHRLTGDLQVVEGDPLGELHRRSRTAAASSTARACGLRRTAWIWSGCWRRASTPLAMRLTVRLVAGDEEQGGEVEDLLLGGVGRRQRPEHVARPATGDARRAGR